MLGVLGVPCTMACLALLVCEPKKTAPLLLTACTMGRSLSELLLSDAMRTSTWPYFFPCAVRYGYGTVSNQPTYRSVDGTLLECVCAGRSGWLISPTSRRSLRLCPILSPQYVCPVCPIVLVSADSLRPT